jgi:hypothetical protein
VIANPTYRYGRHPVLPRYASEIRVKPFLHFGTDCGSAFGSRKYDVNQATYVTMRHAFQPSLRDCSGSSNLPQDWRPGLFSAVPSGLRRICELVSMGSMRHNTRLGR